MTDRDSRILVIEDDTTLRETLAEVLVDEGHEVRAAAHGHEALDHLDGWVPDLIVLDLMMPMMDAYEFRERQLLMGIAPDAKTLIVSAGRNLDSAAQRIDADAWIGKPFVLADVIALVDRLLDRPG